MAHEKHWTDQPDRVIDAMKKLSQKVHEDPMFRMYYVKMLKQFGANCPAGENKKLQNSDDGEILKHAKWLRSWLKKVIFDSDNLNLKANYEQSIAFVEEVLADLSPNDEKREHLRLAVWWLERSMSHARRFLLSGIPGPFIYSEMREQLIHASDFIDEVRDYQSKLKGKMGGAAKAVSQS